jgi:hypothetical protein
LFGPNTETDYHLPNDITKSCVLLAQALSKWGNWGIMAPGVANGQSEIKFTKLEFARPADIAAQFEPDEGFTGLVQAVIFEVTDRGLIGYPTKTGHRYCCAKDMVSKTKCSRDRLIYSVRSPVSHPSSAYVGRIPGIVRSRVGVG